jgi:hypothetical protein
LICVYTGPEVRETLFVGCSNWSEDEEWKHCFLEIEGGVDEKDLGELLKNGGHSQTS